jgi:putative transposase
MPGTFSQLLLHIVFSTKHRTPWITPDIADRVYGYIGGIVNAERGLLLAIGGMPDHVHLYIRWRPDSALSDLMRITKHRSSKWIHETFPMMADFAWQEGYAAFSVSKSQEPVVRRYIATQEQHHQREDFKAEFVRLLTAHGVEFEHRYVFE